MSSLGEIQSAHKKALKNLENDKRKALKKAKEMKGKKGKEAITAVEDEYANKLKDLESSYQEQLNNVGVESLTIKDVQVNKETSIPEPSSDPAVDEEALARERKIAKARKKREKQKEKEAILQQQIEEETANAGPSMRQIELEQIETILTPLNLAVSEVEADGHCMYRAVAAQCNKTYSEIRSLCADTLQSNQVEFAPFCEYTDDISTFDDYVNMVRNSAEWGGHLELRALGMALDRPIHVYSVQSGKEPLAIHESDNTGEKDPILLSFHLHYYALGEHYNQVVASKS